MMNIDMIYLEFLASMLIIIYSSKKGNKITVLLIKTNESTIINRNHTERVQERKDDKHTHGLIGENSP